MPDTHTSRAPRDVLAQLLGDVSANRWDRLHELYADDTVVQHPFARDASRRLEGRDALRRHFALFAQSGRRLRARDVVVHDTTDPEVIVAEFRYEGAGPGPDERFEMAACFVWRVRDGLVVDARDYLDRPRLVGETDEALPPQTGTSHLASTSERNQCMSANAIDPNETTAARRRRGEQIVQSLSNGQRPASLDALDRDFPFLANAVHSYAVGELFARDVLDVRTRQLALVAAFAALGLGDFIKIHGGYALNAGATEDELKEIVYLTTIPGGFPRAIQASQAVAELLAERR